MKVALLADTHGLLRPEVLPVVRGSELILHAGDVGDPGILDTLASLAQVRAVRGNVDRGELSKLPATEVVECGEHVAYMLHIREELDLDPAAAGFSAVVFGHSHRPSIERQDGVLYVNPGSCGPRRFTLPVTMAVLEVADEVSAEIVALL